MRARWLVAASLVVFPCAESVAQRTAHDNTNAWFMLGADVAIATRWSVLLDVQSRRSGPIEQPQSFFFRPALIYALTPHLKLGVGVSRSESYPYGEIPSAYQTPERRVFEQIQLGHTLGRVGVTHRYRLEQRWLGRRGADTADHEIATWVRASRFRYQLRGTIPFRGPTVDPREPYAVATNELFIGFGRNVAFNVFDQNRAALALGWKFSKAWRAEAGFLEQMILKSNGLDFERNHTMTLGLYYAR